MIGIAKTVAIKGKSITKNQLIFLFFDYKFVKILKKIAEKIVGNTKFFLVKIKIATQVMRTISLIIKSESAKTPAGKIIILPNKAAKIE